MARTLSEIRKHALQKWMLALLLAVSLPLHAQDLSSPQETDHAVAPPAEPPEVVNTRVFGVLPNYRTTDGRVEFSPITNHQKLAIAAKDSFDWPVYFTTGAYALIYQAENQNPEFGQGLKGYAKRYGATYGDMAIGNMVAEGFLPVLFHEDPRYFRSGDGSTGSRIGGALKQIFVGRKDTGVWGFNYSEFVGGIVTTGISNLYYPNSRTAGDNLQRFAFQIGNDALSNVLKEFWPDIKRHFFEKSNEVKSNPQPFISIEKQP
jgi:hypothetical protein